MSISVENWRIAERIRVGARDISDLVRSAQDANRRIPHLAWTIGDTAAHLITSSRVVVGMTRGEPSPVRELGRMSDGNAMLIAEVTDREPPVLASLLEVALEQVADALEPLPPDQRLRWHADIELSVSALLAIELGECLVHGWDIATALGKKWPIGRDDAILTLQGLTELLPWYVDAEAAAGFRGAYDVRLRGDGSLHFQFDDGTLQVRPYTPEIRIDCHLSVDPASFLLIGYGRISPLMPSLTGKVLAWGSKPWLAAKFTGMLRDP